MHVDFHTRSLLLNIIFSSVYVSVEEVNDLALRLLNIRLSPVCIV